MSPKAELELNVMVPSYWAMSSLDELGDWLGGGTPSKSNSAYWTGGTVPWVSPKDMKRSFIDSAMDRITEAAVVGSAAKFVPPNSILVVTRSGILERVLPVAINTVIVTVNQDIKALVPYDDIEPVFVFYYLKSHDRKIRELCAKTGTTVASVDLPKLRMYPVGIPPRAEQTRIVSAIESLQERSSRTRGLLAEVKPLIAQLRQSVLRSAFSGRLTAEWRSKQNTLLSENITATEQAAPAVEAVPAAPPAQTAPPTGGASKKGQHTQQPEADTNGSPQSTDTKFETATELLQRIRTERRQKWEVAQLAAFEAKGKKPTKGWQEKYREPAPVDDSELPELPEGWCWTNMNELSHWAMYGPRFSSDAYEESGALVLRTTDFSDDGSINLDTPPKIPLDAETMEKYRVSKGDLLITRTGSLGTLAVYPGGADAIAGAFLIHFRLAAAIELSWWVFHYLKGPYGQRYLIEKGTGTGRPNLNMPSINSIPIPLAPHSELVEILKKLSENSGGMDKVSTLVSSLEQSLTQLDQSILSKAFRGELVPQDPNDEPAAELLARIRATRDATAAKKKTLKKKAASKMKKKQSEQKTS
ncbi:hypothetical protein AB833_03715 [Chromatiales bacterium (ex Bugula neritina AB1)]|nr:hypothetical protein AB833_03685 [Chromatiales bacterium (ex Bugula neritina AB1)]OED43453.1 hypothetical protein AB833_03715 [Chromatiales bacterium (ex Bugula neritina AB1)]